MSKRTLFLIISDKEIHSENRIYAFDQSSISFNFPFKTPIPIIFSCHFRKHLKNPY